jgi:hypothetical protein
MLRRPHRNRAPTARRRLVHGCDTAGVAEQYQKFKDAARKLETDQSEEAFDRGLKKMVKS